MSMNGSGAAPVLVDELDLNAVEAALAMLEGGLSPAVTSRASCCEPLAALGASLGDSFSGIEGNQITTTTAETPSKPKRKRSRDPAADVRRRARRREERQALQQQAVHYEQHLRSLTARVATNKRNKSVNQVDNTKKEEEEGIDWEAEARDQLRRRVGGEALNRQLRSKLAASYDVGKRVEQMLVELTRLHEKQGDSPLSVDSKGLMRYVSCFLAATPERALVSANRGRIAEEVREMLREAFSSTDEVFSCFMTVTGLTDVNELFSTSRIRQDCEKTPCLELLTSTPMPCGIQETVEVIWNWLMYKRRINIPGFNYFGVSRVLTEERLEVHHDVQFSGPFEKETFQGVTMMERHEEPDRMVLVYTTKTVKAGGGVGFYEKGWVLVSRSPVDPLHRSIVRTCYRVASDAVGREEGLSSDAPCDHAIFGFVQRKLAKRMSTRLKELQRDLLQTTGRHDLEALIDI